VPKLVPNGGLLCEIELKQIFINYSYKSIVGGSNSVGFNENHNTLQQLAGRAATKFV